MTNTEPIFTLSQANSDFSIVVKTVEAQGEAIIYKNDKPRYIMIDLENNDMILDLTDDEKIEIVSKRILEKYLPAFKELAK